MLELGGAAGFAQKAFDFFLRSQAAGPLHLERNHALQARIPGLKHVAERTDSQLGPQFEAIESHRPFAEAAGSSRPRRR